MRTKALLGMAALAASALAVQAATPVYSLNIVGYVNTTVGIGTSLLANPLDLDGTNSASSVLNLAPLNDGGGAPPGTLNQITVHTWLGASYATAYYESDFTPNNASGNTAYVGWATDNSGSTPIAPPVLAPGTGFFILNTLQVATNTWVGNVKPGPGSTNNAPIGLGTSLVASTLPVSAALANTGLMAFPLAPLNDGGGAPAGTLNQITVHTWLGASYATAYYESDFTPNNASGNSAYVGWATDNSGATPIPAPTINVGNGFFILNTLQTATWAQGLSNGF